MFQELKKNLCITVLLLVAGSGNQLSAQSPDVFSGGSLLDTIGSALGCDLSSRLKADMNVNPLYSSDGTQCLPSVPNQSGRYYADSQCTTGIDFQRTGQQQFCTEALDKDSLGQGAEEDSRQWTLSPGAAYDVGAASLEGLTQPYRTTTTYRQLQTVRGECRLAMRIYKNDLRAGQQGLRPMIALHGGSWSNRGFGAFGIESSAAMYTQQGFVVFAPFYRLLGENEGSSACNQASFTDIVSDAHAALSWVENNSAEYSARGRPVVIGQSAGAHLALSLAVSFPQRVAGGILLYPPTDFEDFLLQVRADAYTNEEGLGILARVLGSEAETYDLSQSPVPENSFPSIVAASPQIYPPLLIVHGLADELVQPRQSIRLCNALAGRPVDDNPVIDPSLQTDLVCGENSELTLFAEGEHALDICPASGGLISACLSGSEASRQLVATRLETAAVWSGSVGLEEKGGGGTMPLTGMVYLLLLWLFQLVGICRYHGEARR